MLFGTGIDELLDRVKLDKKDLNYRAIAGRKLNLAQKQIGNISTINWEHLKRIGEFVTVPNYTTGTCTISQDSRVVTFSGSTIVAAMVGRYFQPYGTSNWYKIISVNSSSQITLQNPIAETSASAVTFSIWKRFYYFPSEVRKILDFGSWIQDGVLVSRSMKFLHDQSNDVSNTGEPTDFAMFGIDPIESEYSTGTVTLTKDNATVTGSGTSWLDNIGPGDIFEVASKVYRVKRVASDTSIILVNRSISDVPAGTSYVIRKDSPLGVQFSFSPNSKLVLPYTYVKRIYDMVNETWDRPELPEDFDNAILDGAEASYHRNLDRQDWVNLVELYRGDIKDLRTTGAVSVPRAKQMRPTIKSRGAYL